MQRALPPSLSSLMHHTTSAAQEMYHVTTIFTQGGCGVTLGPSDKMHNARQFPSYLNRLQENDMMQWHRLSKLITHYQEIMPNEIESIFGSITLVIYWIQALMGTHLPILRDTHLPGLEAPAGPPRQHDGALRPENGPLLRVDRKLRRAAQLQGFPAIPGVHLFGHGAGQRRAGGGFHQFPAPGWWRRHTVRSSRLHQPLLFSLQFSICPSGSLLLA